MFSTLPVMINDFSSFDMFVVLINVLYKKFTSCVQMPKIYTLKYLLNELIERKFFIIPCCVISSNEKKIIRSKMKQVVFSERTVYTCEKFLDILHGTKVFQHKFTSFLREILNSLPP